METRKAKSKTDIQTVIDDDFLAEMILKTMKRHISVMVIKQVELSSIVDTDILDELKAIDTSNMTPIQALTLLDDLSKRAKTL